MRRGAGRHAAVPALRGDGGQVWGGVPSRPVAGRGEEGRAPVPCGTAACSMHQVLPDLTSQVAAGPSADPAAVAIAEGTAGATPGASAAAADEPPDAHRQAGQHEQSAQHGPDDHSHTLGVCGEKWGRGEGWRSSFWQPDRFPTNQEVPGQGSVGKTTGAQGNSRPWDTQ